MKKTYLYFICLIVVTISILFSKDALALNFQIDKGKVHLNLPAGWSDGGTIEVSNKGDEDLNVRVYVADWQYSDYDGAKTFYSANTLKNSCADWIKFYPADFAIAAHEKQVVNFVVEVPKEAEGGYYAVLFFEVQTGVAWDKRTGSYVKVFNRLGSLFYVEPEGKVIKRAAIENFIIEELAGVIKVSLTFKNTGDAHITTKGTFDIIDDTGVVLARGSFGDIYSMAGDSWDIEASSVSSGFSKGAYSAIVTFDLGDAVVVGEWKLTINEEGSIIGVKNVE